jgi:hypothetical protein
MYELMMMLMVIIQKIEICLNVILLLYADLNEQPQLLLNWNRNDFERGYSSLPLPLWVPDPDPDPRPTH